MATVQVRLALGADLTADPGTWSWTDVTTRVHQPAGIAITRGRRETDTQTPPATLRLTFRNGDGRFVPRNPSGAYYGTLSRNTPIQVRVDPGSGYVSRFVGYVDEWPPTWDPSLSQSLVSISASGLLRRLNRSNNRNSDQSALYRAHAQVSGSTTVAAYWPCEDEAEATSLAPAIGTNPLLFNTGSIEPASDADIAGSAPLAKVLNGGYWASTVNDASSTTTAIRAVIRVQETYSATRGFLNWTMSGDLTEWGIGLTTGSDLLMTAVTSGGSEQLGDPGAAFEDADGNTLIGQQIYVEINLVQNGSDIDWDYTIYAAGSAVLSNSGTETSRTLGAVSGFYAFPGGATTIGHLAVADSTSYGAGAFGSTGWVGETAVDRFTRIGTERSLPLSVVDTSVVPSTRMGAPSDSSDLSQLQEAETAEQGLMYDGLDGTVVLLARGDRLNRAVDLALDFDAGEIAPPFEPTDDDQFLANDVTVDRPDGGKGYRATDAASIAEVGSYDKSLSVNVETDADLPYHAQWAVHLGTVDDLRYPTITLLLHSSTGLVAEWLGCDIGSRVTVDNPPAGLPPDPLDLHIDGYTETFGEGGTWIVSLNTSPAAPWQAFIVEGTGNTGRLDTDGSDLGTSVTSTTTSWSVDTTGAALWSTTATPYDWNVEGERVTVTAMSGASSPQTATVTRAVNGVSKSHSAGVAISLWRPNALSL